MGVVCWFLPPSSHYLIPTQVTFFPSQALFLDLPEGRGVWGVRGKALEQPPFISAVLCMPSRESSGSSPHGCVSRYLSITRTWNPKLME